MGVPINGVFGAAQAYKGLCVGCGEIGAGVIRGACTTCHILDARLRMYATCLGCGKHKQIKVGALCKECAKKAVLS